MSILQVLNEYRGEGFLLILYCLALCYLLIREKEAVRRALLVYLPLIILALFFLPPVHALYVRLEDASTYYRILWLLPMSMSILYAALCLFEKHLKIGLVVTALVLVLCGRLAYTQDQVVRAQNRLHLPPQALSVADTITNDMGDAAFIKAAAPPELVPFIRQYDTRIRLAYGREMFTENWNYTFESSVYEVMIKDEIRAEELVKATRENLCNYVIVNQSKKLAGDPEELGLILISRVDGYLVYRDPQITETW